MMCSEEKFLRQSYLDAEADYLYSIAHSEVPSWDWIAVTASNDRQAEAYQIQLDSRKERGLLHPGTRYIVVADIGGERIGSGGATLNVLYVIAKEIGFDRLLKQKILVIHSGGDSRRIPQYSACGKLFSPIPRALWDGENAVLLDELLMAVTRVPSRVSYGMLIMPGDTELLFNPLQLELFACDAAGLSMKANLSEGKEHGVFLSGADGIVKRFLHKQTESVLREVGAANQKDQVDIDTGCIWLDSKLVLEMTGLFYENGNFLEERFGEYVNGDVRLNFYNDFVMPLASEVCWEEYRDSAPENGFSEQLIRCRERIWERLHRYSIKLVRMAPARYIHVGMTEELYDLMVRKIGEYRYLGWEKRILCNQGAGSDYSGINSYVGDKVFVSGDSYLENCVLTGKVEVCGKSILSGLSVNFDIELPTGVVIHGLKLKSGQYVCRIYGIEDNPKGSIDSLCLGSSLRRLMQVTGMEASLLWEDMPPSIWNAKLYAVSDTEEKALKNAVILYQIFHGQANSQEIEEWKNMRRISLQGSFEEADISALLLRQREICSMVRCENIIRNIVLGEDVFSAFQVFSGKEEAELLFLKAYADETDDLFLKMRLYLGLNYVCGKFQCKVANMGAGNFEDMIYVAIKEYILKAAKEMYSCGCNIHFAKDKIIKKLPVRVNFCGSPSDAAPYCLEYGGTMLNGALLLRGNMPICVEVLKTVESVIEFESVDSECSVIYHDLSLIKDCGNPYDTFALHKAVLIAAGIVSYTDTEENMEELCARLGGGLKLVTSVNVPRGSGLGTSSILAACAISAVYELFGIEVEKEKIYSDVFVIEQLMNTGGGWQDQVGGYTPGLKYIYSRPGIFQNLKVDMIKLDRDIRVKLQERFVLIFSGQRRLARSVLREEMNQCIRNHKNSMEVLEEIRRICALMKFEIERGNITAFANYISEQFELVKTLDRGASNTCIEYIFDCCADLIDGKSVCGAGGGGFLQVILKEGITRAQLEERIREHFEGCGVEVWDSTFLWEA